MGERSSRPKRHYALGKLDLTLRDELLRDVFEDVGDPKSGESADGRRCARDQSMS